MRSLTSTAATSPGETGERAKDFIAETIERNGLVPHTVHSDRGTSMTSRSVSGLLIDLGVARSHSRPKTSNDNPFSEANFKTIKYCGDYPESFVSIGEARAWREGFIGYYNHEDRHFAASAGTPRSASTSAPLSCSGASAPAPSPRPTSGTGERFGRRPVPPALPDKVWIDEPQPQPDPVRRASVDHTDAKG